MPGPPHPGASLSAYVDGRLPAWRRGVVGRHLSACTRCAVEAERLRALRRLLADSPVPPPPPELQERLLAIGRPAPGPVPDPADPPVRPARPLVGAAAVLTAVLLVLGAAGVGAVVTGAMTPTSGGGARASFSTVLPRLLSWPPADPRGATTVGDVDNGDRP
ncbi:zf-HC2 domain-containing protein [Jannaschia sp. R86511]|uniref:zf-HC2 domain-containing protein n=1 Tax=Jannaschia sp. R86511 TaxID=3093853 RepID=UPI0036D41C26